MREFLKKHGWVLLIIMWEIVRPNLYYISVSFGRYSIAPILVAMQLATIVISYWSISYVIACMMKKTAFWPLLSNKWVGIPTVVTMVSYSLFKVLESSCYILDVGEALKPVWRAFNEGTYVMVGLLLILVVAQYYKVIRTKDGSQEVMIANAHNISESLARIEQNQKSLRGYCEQRLQLTLYMRELYLKTQDASLLNLPDVISTDAQWDEFVAEYDKCHDGVLTCWRQRNPRLTDSDVLYMVLLSEKMTSRDISLLLDSSDRTVWNRRQLVKEHLGIELSELEDWLKETC